VVFVTVEDEHCTASLVGWAYIGARDQDALLGARLLVVEATIKREAEHAEVPITQLICRTPTDHTELLNSLMHHDANLPCGCDIQKGGRNSKAGSRVTTGGQDAGEPGLPFIAAPGRSAFGLRA
jgi:DNA polymerase III alpha subunit